jgi:hypothetical protein
VPLVPDQGPVEQLAAARLHQRSMIEFVLKLLSHGHGIRVRKPT